MIAMIRNIFLHSHMKRRLICLLLLAIVSPVSAQKTGKASSPSVAHQIDAFAADRV
jgi:hypothetical protein